MLSMTLSRMALSKNIRQTHSNSDAVVEGALKETSSLKLPRNYMEYYNKLQK